MKATLSSGVLYFLLWAACACATESDANLAEIMDRSEVIVVASINSGTDSSRFKIGFDCGYEYEATVIRSILASRDGSRIQFRSTRPLEMSGVYLIFLSNSQTSSNDSLESLSSDISASECATGSTTLVPIRSRLVPNAPVFGPEVIFELRRFEDAEQFISDNLRDEVFTGPLAAGRMFQNSAVKHGQPKARLVEIERTWGKTKEIAFEKREFLQFLSELVSKDAAN
jgi:hypothetical protein